MSRRLVLAVAAAGAVAGIVLAIGALGRTKPGPVAREPLASTATPAASAAVSVEPDRPAPRADETHLQNLAARFTAAWLRTDQPRTRWLADLGPLVTNRLYTGLRYTDLTSVPTGHLVGHPVVAYASDRDALVDVQTTTGRYRLTLTCVTGWRVASIAPAR